MNIAVFLVLGLLIGSFLTSVVERLPRGRSFAKGRSRCPHCRHVLKAADLIPVISFLALRGSCRYCGKRIPAWHLGVELGTAALFALTAFRCSTCSVAELLLLSGLLACLLALAVIDIRTFLLPDSLVIAVALLGFSRGMVFQEIGLRSSLLGALLGGGLLWLLSVSPWISAVVLRRSAQPQGPAMGLGDVKLAAAMGLTLGAGGLISAFFFSFVTGGVFGATLLLTRQASLKSHIPFGPFLTAGTAVVLLWPELSRVLLHALGMSYN